MATFPLAALPLSAYASLVSDKTDLAVESLTIKETDDKLNKERNLAFQDEIAIEKANDAYVEALKRGDKKEVEALKLKIQALTADYEKQEKQVIALGAKEAAEVEKEEKLKGQVKNDEEVELKLEDKEIIEAEEALIEKNVGEDAFSKVKNILGF